MISQLHLASSNRKKELGCRSHKERLKRNANGAPYKQQIESKNRSSFKRSGNVVSCTKSTEREAVPIV
jgi:hypothetical protein